MTLATLLITLLPGMPSQEPAPVELRLESPLRAGQDLSIRLRSTLPGAKAWLGVGPIGSYDLLGPGKPLFGINPYGPGEYRRGRTGADGQWVVDVTIPAGAVQPGQALAWQGAVQDPYGGLHVAPRQVVIAEPTNPTTWADASTALPAAVRTEATTIPHAGDFDRDGDLDIVVVGESTIHYLRNEGGSFVADSVGRFPAELGYAKDVDVADFDGDALPDIVFVGRQDTSGWWQPPLVLRNDGAGSFQRLAELPSDLDEGSRVEVGDVDGDGDADIVVSIGGQHSGGGFSVQSLAIFRNQGGLQGGTLGAFVEDAAFASDLSFNNDTYTVTSVELADVDNDADLDIFVSTTGSGGAPNDLLLNDGTGAFRTVGATQLPGFLDKSGAAIFEDFNGDGYLDVFVCNSHWTVKPSDSGDMMINLGINAPGHFMDLPHSEFPDIFDDNLTIRNYALAGDVDADGDSDLIVLPHEFMGSQGTLVGSPTLFLNQGGLQGGLIGRFFEASGFWAPGTSFVAGGGLMADLDNDGDLDVLATSIGGVLQASKVQDYLVLNQRF